MRSWRGVAAWVLAGCWGLWALVRLFGVDRVPWLDVALVPLLAFTPYVAAAAIVSAGYAALVRRWAAAAAATVVAIGLVAALVPRALADRAAANTRGPALRVLSVNLRFGRADPGAVVALVRRSRADLVSVQELTPAAVTGLRRAGLGRVLAHQVLAARPRAAGSGLYARYPLRPLGEVGAAARSGFALPRALMTLPGGRTVDVVAVHTLPPTSPAQVRQWRRDLTGLAALPEAPAAASPAGTGGRPPRILAGDFNATLDNSRLRALLEAGYRDAAEVTGRGLVPTFGASRGWPPITIDHVLVDTRLPVRAVSIDPIPGSDHHAVTAELRLP